jgi:DNA-binding NtrC family response regulator
MSSLPARILFVDDDPDTCSAMVRLLKNQGFDARAAGSCEQALCFLSLLPIDLLITDFALLDGDGLTILEHARKLYPIEGILISGVDEQNRDEDGLLLSIAAQHFAYRLDKPILFPQLIKLINELLAPSRLTALSTSATREASAATRTRTLRQKVKTMTTEEMTLLSRALKRHGDDLKEELQVLSETMRARQDSIASHFPAQG